MLTKLFFAGDLMCGRGIDQILPRRGDPHIYEPYVQHAGDYVRLAEEKSGRIPSTVDYAYPWGIALDALSSRRPHVRLTNLETSLTSRGEPRPHGLHYRMNPGNMGILEVAEIDCCSLANNHVLDWGEDGLSDTLETLDSHHIRHAGAGPNDSAAETPAVLPLPNGRNMLVFAYATRDSGVPPDWAADAHEPGVAWLPDLSTHTLRRVAQRIRSRKRPGDLVVVSLHWGSNWDFGLHEEQTRFARDLIDEAGVDLIHGHSSHHVKALEVYRERLIAYGCGDLLNDYEGIDGHDDYRGDLGLLYFASLNADGRLAALELLPIKRARLRLTQPDATERDWLRQVLSRDSARFGCSLEPTTNDSFTLTWPATHH